MDRQKDRKVERHGIKDKKTENKLDRLTDKKTRADRLTWGDRQNRQTVG